MDRVIYAKHYHNFTKHMKKVAITVGVFDCLHEGHVNLLKNMREMAEDVKVFIHNDLSTFHNKGRFPVQKEDHRWDNLFQSRLADEVIIVWEEDPGYRVGLHIDDLVLKGILPSEIVYVRGDDWKDFPGRKVIEEKGVEIVFIPYTNGVSTTMIRNELRSDNPREI